MVSVFMITYNHEKYIAKALESILMQKVEFDFEVVIGEDCSTDNTRNIILKYADKYPDKFKLLLHERNIGPMANHIAVLNACTGKYIAMLEGDDYWISPLKLKTQVDFLEANPEYSICSHNAIVEYEETGEKIEWLGREQKETITLDDLLAFGSGGATCSLIFRNKIFRNSLDLFYTLPSLDWISQILCASKGKMKYFKEPMGVYRRTISGNSTDAGIKEAKKQNKEWLGIPYKNTLKIIDAIDKYFDYKKKMLLNNQRIYCYYVLAKTFDEHNKSIKAILFSLKTLKYYFGNYPFLTKEIKKDTKKTLCKNSIIKIKQIIITFINKCRI
jgi:glycosyltransferase involved in cell wall biosynthesis